MKLTKREERKIDKALAKLADVSATFRSIANQIDEFRADFKSDNYAPGIVWSVEQRTRMTVDDFKWIAGLLGLRDGEPKAQQKRVYRSKPGYGESKVAGFLCSLGMIKSKGSSAIRQYRRLVKRGDLTHPCDPNITDAKMNFWRDIDAWTASHHIPTGVVLQYRGIHGFIE